ncbi:hypothetical protein AACH10_03015 [Ideonella sp. DXS22W]|uniref:Type II secretion system protein GspC N-terminal domain-containing protein n=1 Tax=Pseudaquabacterium inlustre TaxID=2984192 RepID=A0ABU9CE81_9BURK
MPALPTPSLVLPLFPPLGRRLLRGALAAATAAVAAVGAAVVAAPPLTALPDPTRPPAALATTTVPGPIASGRVSGAAPAQPAAEAARAPALPRLQAVQLRQGNETALIDDRMVRVGDKVGDRVVVAIDAEGVLLRGAAGSGNNANGSGGERRLRLLGGDEKQPPGTIQITRSARWQPPAEPLVADPALAGASAPGRPAPVSLAERTRP